MRPLPPAPTQAASQRGWVDVHGLVVAPGRLLGPLGHIGQMMQGQHHRPDHRAGHADVEGERAGQADISDQRDGHILIGALQERRAQRHGRQSCQGRHQHPEADQPVVIHRQPPMSPDIARRHVLHQQGDGDHQAGDEAAAGLVVAAQEDVETDHQGQRQ